MAPAEKTCLALLLITGFSVLAPFLIHVLLTRIFRLFVRPDRRQKGPLWSAGIGLGLLLIFLSAASGEAGGWGPMVYSLGVYFLFAYVYFHFFNMSETARRIRILIESARSPTVRQVEVVEVYTPRQMVRIRIARLVELGELREKEGRYLTGRGILLVPALLVSFFHNLLFPPEIGRGDH